MKRYIDELLRKSPIEVISAIYMFLAAAAAFVLTLQKGLDGVSGWGDALIVIAAALLQMMHGFSTRPEIYSNNEVDELTAQAHSEGKDEGHREALAYAVQKRKDAAAKGAQTRARLAAPVSAPKKRTGRR